LHVDHEQRGGIVRLDRCGRKERGWSKGYESACPKRREDLSSIKHRSPPSRMIQWKEA
jgi:hypothetical protein